MTAQQAAVVNQSLQMIDAQTQIADLGDGTTAGNAAAVLYTPTVQLLLRQNDPDFARFTTNLTLTTDVASTPPPWLVAYYYPADCLRLRQVFPSPRAYNINDPYPVLWAIQTALAEPGDVPVKVVTVNLLNALAVYTTSLVTESEWDSVFEQAVVRQLANPLAMALAGRPDFAKDLLETAARYEQLAEMSDESMARSV